MGSIRGQVLGCSCDTLGLFLPLKRISISWVAEGNTNVVSFSLRPEAPDQPPQAEVPVWVGLVS